MVLSSIRCRPDADNHSMDGAAVCLLFCLLAEPFITYRGSALSTIPLSLSLGSIGLTPSHLPSSFSTPPKDTSISMYGKIVNVNERGFGFIESEIGERYFYHRSETENFDALAVRSSVSFTLSETPKGKRASAVAAV